MKTGKTCGVNTNKGEIMTNSLTLRVTNNSLLMNTPTRAGVELFIFKLTFFFVVPQFLFAHFLLNFEKQSSFQMNKETDYLKDIGEIKDIMNRSSRFISLSGLSGVMAGIYALVGACIAYEFFYNPGGEYPYQTYVRSGNNTLGIIVIAATILLLSVITGILLTTRKARKKGLKVWDLQAKRMLINLAIPLFTGGVLCLILLFRAQFEYIAALTLIFYGLSLVNASRYTLNEIRGLGIIQIILGLLAAVFIGYELWFWATGFGLFHIIYGIYMHQKYE